MVGVTLLYSLISCLLNWPATKVHNDDDVVVVAAVAKPSVGVFFLC